MLEEKFTALYSEMDAENKMSLRHFLVHAQEAAADDAKNQAFGNGDFEQNLVWVLTRMQVQMLKNVSAKEIIKLKSWHSFTDKLISRREFIFTNQNGTAVMQGASWWLLMNLDTRKITRMPQSLIDLNSTVEGPLIEEGNFKMPNYEGASPVATLNIIVRESDIDSNRHVNNTHFAAWALESAPVRKVANLKEALISFKAECFEKDIINVYVYTETDYSFWHVLIRESDKKEVARVHTSWQKK